MQLAQRLTAYQSVMAARLATEQDSPAPAPSNRPRDTEELELDEFQQQFPDLVSVSRVPQQ